ncbi:hypothetical protein GOODEAATRI_007944, partial [Goodea atripinnis]
MPLTHAGPNLISLWPPIQTHSKTPKSRRGESVWDAPPALTSLVKQVYLSMVGTRRDHKRRQFPGLLSDAGRTQHRNEVEEKQRASVAFTKLLSAMETLSFSSREQKAIWHVLAAIYHLGAAGACKVGRRQFVNFDSAQAASSILGCEAEELDTAVFKHHLRQLLQKATGVSRERNESEEGPRLTASQCVDGMAAGLYEELFTTIVSLINRSGQQMRTLEVCCGFWMRR